MLPYHSPCIDDPQIQQRLGEEAGADGAPAGDPSLGDRQFAAGAIL